MIGRSGQVWKIKFPREEGIDHSLQLLKEGYHFIVNRQRDLQSDVFETRLLGKKTICMVGGRSSNNLL